MESALFYKKKWAKSGPVTGLGGCGMLLENLRPWIDKSVRQ